MLISHTIGNPNCEVIQLRARSSQLHNAFNTLDDYYWHNLGRVRWLTYIFILIGDRVKSTKTFWTNVEDCRNV